MTVEVFTSSVYVAVPKVGDRGPEEEGAVAEYSDMSSLLQNIDIRSSEILDRLLAAISGRHGFLCRK